MEEKEIRKIIRNEMDSLKIPHYLTGYKLIETAVYYIVSMEMDNPDFIVKMEEVYYYIKKKHKSTRQKSERNMRTAFGLSGAKESNKKMIYYLVYLVQEKIEMLKNKDYRKFSVELEKMSK